ncbi:transketolase [Streptomyces sp. SAS_270]|uniref:transketolase n=1 Tax=Streptomyces sp. SAS_270 TaxID=3412748 RepID=UPI00403CFC70
MQSEMLTALTETLPDLAREDSLSGGSLLIGYESAQEVGRFAARAGWSVHVPGHPDEVRAAVRKAAAGTGQAYIHVSRHSNAEPRAAADGFEMVREGRAGVVLAVGATLDPVLRATAGLDLAVLYATTVRPFDAVGLRTAVLAADHADVVLAEPYPRGTCAHQVAETLVHVPHRLLALGDEDGLDGEHIARALRDFVR